MTTVTQQQRDNALEALHVMWPSVPPENVAHGLNVWRVDRCPAGQPPTCGSTACFGGWCAWWPAFQAQGISVGTHGRPKCGTLGPAFAALVLFGFEGMFAARDHLIYFDPEVRDLDENPANSTTDHQIVTRRLEWLIANSEVKGTKP